MITVHHFVYGLFGRSGYKLFYTAEVKKLLKKESLQQLQSLQLPKGKKQDIVTLHFPYEDIITRSYLQASNDIYGRDGIINHTIIMKISDFLHEFPEALDIAFHHIKTDFITQPPKTNLQPIMVEKT